MGSDSENDVQTVLQASFTYHLPKIDFSLPPPFWQSCLTRFICAFLFWRDKVDSFLMSTLCWTKHAHDSPTCYLVLEGLANYCYVAACRRSYPCDIEISNRDGVCQQTHWNLHANCWRSNCSALGGF